MKGGPVPWSTVIPGDRVLAADGMWWTCTNRTGARLTIEREGRAPVARRAPAGAVRCIRGPEGQALVEAATAFVGAGFTVDVIGYQ